MAKMSYKEQLKHPEWQKKRLKMLEKSGWKCDCCDDNETTLHVHHKFYVNGRMAWEYEEEDFVVLCEDCHDEHHQWEEVYRSFINHVPFDIGPDSLGEICAFLSGYLSQSRAQGIVNLFNDHPDIFTCGEIAKRISISPALRFYDLNLLLAGFDDVDFVFAFRDFLRSYKKESA